MDDKTFAANTPADFTDALKWYAVAQEKQNDYQNTYKQLQEQMECNMRLRQETNQLRNEMERMRSESERNQNGAAYLLDLLNRAARNVHELRIVFRDGEPRDEDEE